MAKKMKQVIYRWPLFSTVGVLAVFSILGVSAAVYGVSQFNTREEIKERAAKLVAEEVLNEPAVETSGEVSAEDEVSLGSTFAEQLDKASTSTTELSTQNNISIFDRLRFGDPTLARGVTYKVKILEKQSATNTVLFLTNKEGNNSNRSIWIDRRRIALQILGSPSINTNICIGTGTSEWVNTSNVFINSTITPTGICGIFQPGTRLTSTNAPTSSIFFASDWPGTATTDWLELKPGESIRAYATSTAVLGVDSVTTTASLFKFRLFVPYVYFD